MWQCGSAAVAQMLGQVPDEQIAATRFVIDELEPEGREDLESLIVLGRLELEQGGEGE
jgi:hypothetical protein